MVFFFRTALLAAMALTFFGQQSLGMPVEMSTEALSMPVLDKRMALADPTVHSGNVVGSVTTGVLSNTAQMKTIATGELPKIMAYIQAKGLTESKGITVYMNSEERKIVVAAIGAGTGMHGEQNVQTLCEQSGVTFHGGKIFTYTTQWGFISACGEADASGPNRRNCAKLIRDADIEDVATQLK
jgi:hypothetical protein